MQRDDRLLEEYRNVNENMRHYGNMRFKQLTLFNVMNGALVAGFIAVVTGAGKDKPIAEILRLGFEILGIILVVLFALLEERSSDYWNRFHKRAQRIECMLGLRQHRERPRGVIFTATNATRVLYFVVLVFWASLLTNPPIFSVLLKFFKDSKFFKNGGFFIILGSFVVFLVVRYVWVKKRHRTDC